MKTQATKKKATRPTSRKPATPRISRRSSGSRDGSSADLVSVFVSSGPYAARFGVAKGKLESEGIAAMIQSEAQSTFPLTVDELGEVRVLVTTTRALLERTRMPTARGPQRRWAMATPVRGTLRRQQGSQ